MYSLKRVLLFSLLSTSILISAITAYIDYVNTEFEITELFDAELSQSAKVLNSLIEGLLQQHSLSRHWQEKNVIILPDHNISGHRYEKKIAFQLISKQYGLILRSASAPSFPLQNTNNGYSQINIEGHLWKIFSLNDFKGNYIIHVGQRDDIRKKLIADISKNVVIQFLLRLLIFTMLIWLIVGYFLRPIEHLAQQLSQRKASYLEPLSTIKVPNELIPAVHALNTLFARLKQAFENERRFTADAAHELKTPLAGLRTQAQVALKTRDETVRTQALKQIEQVTERTTHIIQQLLTLAQIEANTNFLLKEKCNLTQLLVQVSGELEPTAYQRQIELSFLYEEELFINASAALLEILIRNLLSNAIKYTPNAGQIQITQKNTDNIAQFCVEDSGQGIAEADYEHVFKRFYRNIETAQTTQGSGLGLSIVQRIIILHEAEINLAVSQFGGLKVCVYFPA